MLSRAEALVAAVNRADIAHRKGWKPSDNPHALNVIDDLKREVKELEDALVLLGVRATHPDLCPSASAHAEEEVADVVACVLQIMLRLGMSCKKLDKEVVRKVKLRFPGAERLEY